MASTHTDISTLPGGGTTAASTANGNQHHVGGLRRKREEDEYDQKRSVPREGGAIVSDDSVSATGMGPRQRDSTEHATFVPALTAATAASGGGAADTSRGASIVASFAHSPYARGPGYGLHRESSSSELLAQDDIGAEETGDTSFYSGAHWNSRGRLRTTNSNRHAQAGAGHQPHHHYASSSLPRRPPSSLQHHPPQFSPMLEPHRVFTSSATTNFAPPPSSMISVRNGEGPQYALGSPPDGPFQHHHRHALGDAGVLPHGHHHPHHDDHVQYNGGLANLAQQQPSASFCVVCGHPQHDIHRELVVLQSSFEELQRQYGQKCGEVIVLQNTVAVMREQLQELEYLRQQQQHQLAPPPPPPPGYQRGGQSHLPQQQRVRSDPRATEGRLRQRAPSEDACSGGDDDDDGHLRDRQQRLRGDSTSAATTGQVSNAERQRMSAAVHTPSPPALSGVTTLPSPQQPATLLPPTSLAPPPQQKQLIKSAATGAVLFCELCQISVNSDTTLRAHLQGERHRKALQRAGAASADKASVGVVSSTASPQIGIPVDDHATAITAPLVSAVLEQNETPSDPCIPLDGLLTTTSADAPATDSTTESPSHHS